MNPYPTKPGFPARVAYAVARLKALAEGRDQRYCKLTNEWYSAASDRKMDNCFENYDGDAVAWEIMRRSVDDATLRRGAEMSFGNAEAFAHWKAIAAYQGPQLRLAL